MCRRFSASYCAFIPIPTITSAWAGMPTLLKSTSPVSRISLSRAESPACVTLTITTLYFLPISRTAVAAASSWLTRLSALDESTVSYLQERYHITTVDISRYGLGWDNESDRLCIPTSDFLGNRTGVVLRALDKRQPKTKTHTEKDALSWFVNHSATIPGLIIVEDQFSAIRASRYLTSVALLGTHLNDQRVAEVRACKLRPVYLALDADAWSTAVRYAVRYRSELRPHLLRLERDLKDLSPEELQEFMNGI